MHNNLLQKFRINSLKSCYLGDMKRADTTERKGFYEMTYSEGDLDYRDSFVGFYISAGQEIIRLKEQPVWVMSYGGGMVEKYQGDSELFVKLESFLRKILTLGVESESFTPRGPESFSEGDFKYVCVFKGDFDGFRGTEEIYLKDEKIFFHNFFGGRIIGK